MKIVIPKEIDQEETRVALVPSHGAKLISVGAEVVIEAGLGLPYFSDISYGEVGVKISKDITKDLGDADIVLRIKNPKIEDLNKLKKGVIHVNLLDPFRSLDLINHMAKAHITAFGMELIPRTTLAQKMDVLSSQASLAGYVAVTMAAERLPKLFPMMTTPAGTLSPARVFVIGAGVAGLQAIATAKRLGARVEAFDTRPAVEEQVASLGAKFIKVEMGETGETKQGYAKALTEDQLNRQREVMAKQCALADVVITTAQILGKKAPIIVTKDMLKGMKCGSVVVDLAVDTGGNVEGISYNKEEVKNGVTLVGYTNLAGRIPVHASQMYSSNLVNFLTHFWNKEEKCFSLKLEDEIIKSALVTHQGEVVNTMLKGGT